LAYLPVVAARGVFAAVTSSTLAFLITRHGWTRVPIFLSAAFVLAIGRSQWSPLLLAACVMPALGFVIAAKPNIGLSVVSGQSGWRSLLVVAAGAAAIGVASLVVRPSWPSEWLQAIGDKGDAVVPAAQWMVGGPLIVLALAKWRRPEARVVATLALTPHSPFLYDTLPLFAVPRSTREALVLTIGTDAAMLMQLALGATAGRDSAHVTLMARAIVVCVYLPCVVMLLRRANEHSTVGKAGEPYTSRWIDRLLWVVAVIAFCLFVFAILGSDRRP
jgi:hypothetical protein